MFWFLLFLVSFLFLGFGFYTENEVFFYLFLALFIISFIFGFNLHGLVYSFFSSYDWSTFFYPLPLEVFS